MLILTRKRFEKIFIGDNIEIYIKDIRDGRVHIGITAPKGVHIKRDDIVNEQPKDYAP